MKKIISALLACTCFLSLFTTPVYAIDENDDEGNENTVYVSSTAGSHGSYCYDAETNETTFIPSDSTENIFPENDPAMECSDEITDPELDRIMKAALTENRKIVTTPTGYERSTCLIGARFADGTEGVAVGTGWLINNNYLITAGHCAYSYEFLNNGRDGWAKHIAIYIGASNGTYIQYRSSTKYDVGGDYATCKNYDDYETAGMWDDWAVLKLNSPVTTFVSKLGVKETNSATEMYGNTYSTQGYPLIEGNITKWFDRWNEWAMYRQTNCTIQGDLAQPYYLHLVNSTTINFTYGQSGSPIYRNGAAEGMDVGDYGGSTAIILLNTWLCNRIKTKYT